ncbi:hypothetical protein ACRALDRAFT_205213 [Sodiomyces alcalophilus JCM 7366]|uniref:uncharacterized protein n=1 Tax=Sodiomyces alcalophilus JCM 7366 TaxID=591952 RepID=UPI0039B3AAA3
MSGYLRLEYEVGDGASLSPRPYPNWPFAPFRRPRLDASPYSTSYQTATIVNWNERELSIARRLKGRSLYPLPSSLDVSSGPVTDGMRLMRQPHYILSLRCTYTSRARFPPPDPTEMKRTSQSCALRWRRTNARQITWPPISFPFLPFSILAITRYHPSMPRRHRRGDHLDHGLGYNSAGTSRLGKKAFMGIFEHQSPIAQVKPRIPLRDETGARNKIKTKTAIPVNLNIAALSISHSLVFHSLILFVLQRACEPSEMNSRPTRSQNPSPSSMSFSHLLQKMLKHHGLGKTVTYFSSLHAPRAGESIFYPAMGNQENEVRIHCRRCQDQTEKLGKIRHPPTLLLVRRFRPPLCDGARPSRHPDNALRSTLRRDRSLGPPLGAVGSSWPIVSTRLRRSFTYSRLTHNISCTCTYTPPMSSWFLSRSGTIIMFLAILSSENVMHIALLFKSWECIISYAFTARVSSVPLSPSRDPYTDQSNSPDRRRMAFSHGPNHESVRCCLAMTRRGYELDGRPRAMESRKF